MQDFHLLEAVKQPDGTVVQQTKSTVFDTHSDDYVSQCQMARN